MFLSEVWDPTWLDGSSNVLDTKLYKSVTGNDFLRKIRLRHKYMSTAYSTHISRQCLFRSFHLSANSSIASIRFNDRPINAQTERRCLQNISPRGQSRRHSPTLTIFILHHITLHCSRPFAVASTELTSHFQIDIIFPHHKERSVYI